MKKSITFLMMIVLFIVTVGMSECSENGPSSDNKVAVKTEQMMKEANAQTGMPAIKNWQEKKNLKMIYELRDQSKMVCYAYLVNELNGEVGQFLGKCIGYGIPYSTQFSNPQKFQRIDGGQHYMDALIPQPEPNGLFMPEGLSATWLMMINPKTGDIDPIYVESNIIVSPFPLK